MLRNREYNLSLFNKLKCGWTKWSKTRQDRTGGGGLTLVFNFPLFLKFDYRLRTIRLHFIKFAWIFRYFLARETEDSAGVSGMEGGTNLREIAMDF